MVYQYYPIVIYINILSNGFDFIYNGNHYSTCMHNNNKHHQQPNGTGPFSAIFSVYIQGNLQIGAFIPYWILLIGAVGIVVGLILFGSRVIKTVGNGLNKKQLVPSQGFSSQLCGASFVLIASKLGIPVSTTNALVGAVIGVGIVEDFGGVQWKLLVEVVGK